MFGAGAHRHRRPQHHRRPREPVGRHGAGPAPPAGAKSPVLRIGDRCSIGRASHLVAHRSVVIGDDVITGPSCYVTDQNHVYGDPDGRSASSGRARTRWWSGRARGSAPAPSSCPAPTSAATPSWRPAPSSGARPRPRRAGRHAGQGRAALGPRARAGSPPCATSTSIPPEGWPGRRVGSVRWLRSRGRSTSASRRWPTCCRPTSTPAPTSARRSASSTTASPSSTSGAGRSTTASPGRRTRSSTSGRPPRR